MIEDTQISLVFNNVNTFTNESRTLCGYNVDYNQQLERKKRGFTCMDNYISTEILMLNSMSH